MLYLKESRNYIPSTLTLIQTESYSDKSGTFAYCPALKKVYINDLKSWLELSCSYEACPTYNGADLYLNGELLSEVTIPENVTEIKGSFYNCTSITSVTFPDNIATFPSSLFSHCPNLTSVRLPSSLTVIPNAAFNSCTSLLEIDIPDQVTSMEGSTFSGCSSLKKVTIGSGLKTFSSSEFGNCYFLNDIYIKAPVPPVYKYTSSTQNLFYNIGNDVTIYVPAESVEDYKKSPSFSNYADDIVGYDVE